MGLATANGQEHRYQLCKDEYCDRFPCRIYKEGYRNGREDERPVAYGEGFVDGIEACPRTHKGD